MDAQITHIPLFQSIDSEALKDYFTLTPSHIGAFSLEQDSQPSISLSLFKNSILLKNRAKMFYILHLTFDIKLQILYEHHKDVTSQIIGFKFFMDNKEQVSFFSSDAPQFALALGKILNMKGFQQMFRPIRKLGRGNFATVYQAQRRTDGGRFAVKAFSKQNSYCAKNGKENLINELCLLRDLNVEPHPNVLRLEAVYQSQNSIYVVLELLEGKTLLQTIQERDQSVHLTAQEVKIVMEGLLKGVAHLCKNRVMHRDLKPENVMIRKVSFEPVIVDFGLSTNVDLPEYLFFRCGTPGYVAPQIIALTKSIHLEPTCDIFSLGAIFHILLTRKPLFPGTKYEEVYRANKQFMYNFQGQKYKRIDPEAIDLLTKTLILNSTERITAENALLHPYITGKTLETPNQKDYEVLTAASTPIEKKKKKKFFFF